MYRHLAAARVCGFCLSPTCKLLNILFAYAFNDVSDWPQWACTRYSLCYFYYRCLPGITNQPFVAGPRLCRLVPSPCRVTLLSPFAWPHLISSPRLHRHRANHLPLHSQHRLFLLVARAQQCGPTSAANYKCTASSHSHLSLVAICIAPRHLDN